MATQWKHTTVVKAGGLVELTVPDLRAGESVEVTVRRNGNGSPTTGQMQPRFGSAKGKIEISDDFDAPLDDFGDYV